MLGFFKRKKVFPPFTGLGAYYGKDMYFVRVSRWGWLNGDQIFAIDPAGPRVFTFDPWPQKIFVEAEGVLTVSEYVMNVADQYAGKILGFLDEKIIHEIESLLKAGVISLTDKKGSPEEQFRNPIKTTR